MDNNLLSVCSILVNILIFYRPQQQMNLKNGHGRGRSFSFSHIFGDFSREWSCFFSTASNYKAEHSNSCTFKCVMLSTKGAEFFVNIKSLKGNSKWKLSFHKEMYGNSAILHRLVKGFSHYFVVFKLFVKLAWCQKLVWHWINILYWLLYNIICFLFAVDVQWKTW